MKYFLRKYLFLICFSVFAWATNAQTVPSNANPINALTSSTWKCDGKWSNENPFKQEITYTWDIPGKVIHTLTYGNVSSTSYEWGVRNSGIRMVEEGKFWEFDVFGQVTEGELFFEGSNIYYSYAYGAGEDKMILTDGWELVNTDEYVLRVGNYTEGKWQAVFLEASCVRKK